MHFSMHVMFNAPSDRRPLLALVGNGQAHRVRELMAHLDGSQIGTSKHMKVLRKTRLVLDRRDAQWRRYRCNPKAEPEIDAVIGAVLTSKKQSEKEVA